MAKTTKKTVEPDFNQNVETNSEGTVIQTRDSTAVVGNTIDAATRDGSFLRTVNPADVDTVYVAGTDLGGADRGEYVDLASLNVFTKVEERKMNVRFSDNSQKEVTVVTLS